MRNAGSMSLIKSIECLQRHHQPDVCVCVSVLSGVSVVEGVRRIGMLS